MKKLLIITQYFPPEVGAPQNRLFELAIRLKKSEVDVTVLAAMPNYPKGEVFEGYKDKRYLFEEIEGIKIHRTKIYATKEKGIVKRLRNYFSFVWSSWFIGKKKLDKHYDFVLCESPPLFLGMSAWRIAKNKGAKFIFNVSDLWPESAEKLGLVTNKFFLKMATILEENLYKKSTLITGQTQGIVDNISNRFPNKDVYWLPNGVDLNFYNPNSIVSDFREKNGFSSNDFICLYAGIIGHAQGLEVVLKSAKQLKNRNDIKFVLLGSGPEKQSLLQMKEEEELTNVIFLDVVPKSEMPKIVKGVNASIIPLKRLDLFKGAIPSKIFENLAMELPIVLGVEGEAYDLFIKEGNSGVFFEPENSDELAARVIELANDRSKCADLGRNGRVYVDQKFNRNKIAEQFAVKLSSI